MSPYPPDSPVPTDRGGAPDLLGVVSPVVVLTRTFPARPSAWPETRTFLQHALAGVDPEAATSAVLQEAVGNALLDAAGTATGSFTIVVRITPDDFEVEILGESVRDTEGEVQVPQTSPTFARWISDTLTSEGLSQAEAARQIGVSVRTVRRWMSGETEPRLRDLRRVNEIFGR